MIFVPRKALVAYNGLAVGLGNRVRVTMGAANLAEHHERDFYYVWPTGTPFEPTFRELWDFERGRVIRRATSRALATVVPYVDENLVGLRASAPVWQIRTGAELVTPPGVRSWREDFRRLTPVEEIAGPVTRIFDEHFRGVPYIGVQIRAHEVSHARTTTTSPVEWFERRMAVLAEQNPGVPFYISCDVQEVQDRLVERFTGSFGQRDKGPYNSTRAVRAAIVDLYLLACAGHMVGPYYSSFIHLAEYLGDLSTITENPVEEFPQQPDITAPGLAADPLRPAVRTCLPPPDGS